MAKERLTLTVKFDLSQIPGPDALAQTFAAVMAAVLSGGAGGEIHARVKGEDKAVAAFDLSLAGEEKDKAPAMPKMIGFMTSGGVC